MAQSLSQLFVHITFHVKSTSCQIKDEDSQSLYAYIGSILNDLESKPIIINGMPDHIHIFCSLSKNIAAAKLIEDVKRHSSRWIKHLSDYYKNFSWQSGYGIFSVSPSLYDKTFNYIQNQKNHHKKASFKEELLLFLKQYNIDYDERYLWTD